MSEVLTTLTGFVGDDPKHFVSATGTSFTTFRMATTRRFFDRSKAEWVDGQTLWFTVKSWRDLARNVAESLRKGDAVIAAGIVGVDEWESPDGQRTTLVLEARAVGPDLARGQARFTRTIHRTAPDDARDGGTSGVGGEAGQAGDGGPVEPVADAELADDPWATSLPELAGDEESADERAGELTSVG
ncbi:single-stranded DNA-binding protein [Luteimicrobium sp. DT211]|uniref:single-stranded DNA-binding protein n=1 Tax=Luteimicrobium sp. DT211 TaxID=3393412 RepID=UPI003CF14490